MATDTSEIITPRVMNHEYGRGMHFGVLGPVEVSEARRRLSVGGPKQRTVLALLVARAGSAVSTDALVDGVYGDDAPDGARRSVQTYVSNLRGELGEVIESSGSGYVLTADRSEIDATRFEDALSEAATIEDPESASEVLREALALWRGHPYADVDGLFELMSERSRLTELRMSAIELRVDKDLERGHHRQLIAELDSLTEEHPLRERFRAQQMLALYRCGRQAEALRAYDKTRNYLVDEIGLDPSPDLRELEQRILDQDPSLKYESGPAVKHASILVADIADPRTLSSLGPAERDDVITHQSDAIQDASLRNRGELFAHRGSAIYLSFKNVERAVSAAVATQQTLAETGQTMRMAISVGEVQVGHDETVQGPPVTRAAQLVGKAHGGQVLLSNEANQALADSGAAGRAVLSLGQHDIDGSGETRPVYQLLVEGLEGEFPPLRSELLPLTLPITTTGLPGYELREEVGSGAFGVVHRAYQPSVGREVAIKIIRPEYANDSGFIRRFEVEAQLVARLEHPHIVPLHDYWRNPDGAYLVLRWLGGGTLKDVIAADHLSIDEVHGLLADIGPALDFAHRRGVVHRDIKASNVLFDDEGTAYLTDFGIAGDISHQGVGSVAEDVQALASLLAQCLGDRDEPSVVDLLATATTTRRYIDVRSFITAWEGALAAADSASEIVGYTPTRNPYKGLAAFGELDSADFHGRDTEIEEIIATLAAHPLVAVVGPSGIGKSSVVRAGMIPALRSGAIPGSDDWLITDMLPGTYPYEELASALMRVATEMPNDLEDDLRRDARGLARSVKRYLPEGQTVLLVLDQFEELFTLASENERTTFLDLLAATISDDRSNVRIVITMRADFFDRPLRFADLGDALRAGTIPISAPNNENLHAIVTRPAAGVGVTFAAGLDDHIVDDVKHEPGALPLLEFTLAELFDQRDSDILTLAAYEASGGVLGALGRRAETIYTDLTPSGKEAARETFLRLVVVTEAGRDTRRRARLTELERLGFTDQTLKDVLDALGDHRLLTFDRDPITRGPTIEVAHEAILTKWPRLAGWIDEHREDLLLRSRLAAAVADWETADRADAYLLTAGRLSQHEAWTADTDLGLTSAEQEFLVTSRSAEDERRTRRRRTRRLVMSGFGAAAVIALVLAVMALVARNDAQDQTALAQASEEAAVESEALAEENAAQAEANAAEAAVNENLAIAGEMGAVALDQIDTDPERAVLFGIESLRTAETPSGLNATHTALFNHYAEWGMHGDPFAAQGNAATALHPDGELVLVYEHDDESTSDNPLSAETGAVASFALYDITNPELTPRWSTVIGDGALQSGIFFTWFGDGVVFISITDTDVNPVPTSPVRGVHVLDLETGEVLERVTFGECVGLVIPAIPSLGRDSPLFVDYESIGEDEEGPTCLDPSTDDGYTMRYFPGGLDSTDSIALEFPEPVRWYKFTPHASDDGQLIVIGVNYAMYVTDANTGQPIATYEGDRIAISGDGQRLLINRLDTGYAELRDRETGDVMRTFAGEFRRVTFSVDGTQFIGSSFDGGLHVFDLNTGVEIYELRGSSFNPDVYLSSDPDTLLLGTLGTAIVFDVGQQSEIPVPMGGLGMRLESWGFNGHHSAVSTGGGLIYVPFYDEGGTGYRIFDLADGALVREATDVWRVAAMTHDGAYIAEIPRLDIGVIDPDGETAELFGPIQIVDTTTGEVLIVFDSTCGFYATSRWDVTLPRHEDCRGDQLQLPLSDIEFSADGSRLGVDSWAGTPAVFDTGSGVLLWHTVLDRIPLIDVPAGVVGLSPNGQTFIYRSGDSQTHWTFTAVDVGSGRTLGETEQHNPNYEMLFSADGSRIYAANWSGGVFVYDAGTFELLDKLTRSQGGGVLDFAVRGNLVANATFDKIVRVQTLDTHELLLEIELSVKAENVEWLDDTHLLVITLSDVAFIFTMDGEELIEIATERLTRGFTAEECSSFNIEPCPTLDEIKNG